MKKVIGVLVLLCVSTFLVTGCGSKESSLTMTDFENALTEANIEYNKTEKAFALVSATNGSGYNNDTEEYKGDGTYSVEIYQFDTKSEAYKTVNKDKKMLNKDVTINNGLVILVHRDENNKILDIFKKIK